MALMIALLLPVASASAENEGYFHKGLGHKTPLPDWAKGRDVYFLPPPGEGPAAELAEAAAGEGDPYLQTLEIPEEPSVTYFGGPVQKAPHVHLILWGKGWLNAGEPQALKSALLAVYEGLDNSAYQGILTQYFENSETTGPFPRHIGDDVEFNSSASTYPTRDIWIDEDVVAPENVSWLPVRNEVMKAIEKTGWPTGIDHQFVVVPAIGSTYQTDFQSYCGLHEAIAGSTYTFIRAEESKNTCGGPDRISRTASHEYTESVTDPLPFSGWMTPVLDAEGNIKDRIEIADSCPKVANQELANGAPVAALRDNYLFFTEGALCSAADPDPPQLAIEGSSVTTGQPGEVTVEADVKPAGYPTLKYFVEWKGSIGSWTRAPGGGILEGSGGSGSVHVSVPVTGNAISQGTGYRMVVQIPTDGYEEEKTGRVFGKPILGRPEWPTALCKANTEPCVSADRYPSGTTISGVPDSTYYYPQFQLDYGLSTPIITCLEGGPTYQTTGSSGQAAGLSQSAWTFAGCTVKRSGVSEGSCTVKATDLPAVGGIAWSAPGSGRLSMGTSGDPDPDFQLTCPQLTPPLNCSYAFEPATGTWEGGSPAKLYVHTAFTTPSSADAGESGEACPGRMSSFNAHYYLESPKPLYVTGFGKLQPLVATGGASPVGVGSQTATRLTGTVDPNGFASGYKFQYVSDANYKGGTADPFSAASTIPASFTSVGSGKGAVSVSQDLSGFLPDTTYHYRLIAENAEGLRVGDESTFKTPVACAGGGSCSYSLQSPVNPEPQQQSELADVSCPSATMCMGLGNDYYRNRGFLEVWKSGSWSLVHTYAGTMKALSCPTTTWCMTVAKSDDDAWRMKWFEAVGGFWDVETVSPPLPQGASELKLNDVACTSESACTMVGRYSVSGTYKPYVARWNGTSWSQQTAPSPASGNASEALLGVSCASSTSCLAVGKAAGKPFAEKWTGTEWVLSSVPNPTGAIDASLQGISCTAANACVAVGTYAKTETRMRTLAASFNGTEWTIQSTPNPAKEGDAVLRDVSCLSSASCIAAGSLAAPAALVMEEETTMALSWNGTSWTLQTTPNGAGSSFSSFNAIACSATTACTAVGNTRPGGKSTRATLAARWK